ncbi:uncharacterized protein JCM6883_006792 [Sporobolomyces salmoneus]|uniref:uncharacterized protein n=1 Tax=Sporobolomyces salmoneus TaxID=183962 RepID=UPI00317D9F1C
MDNPVEQGTIGGRPRALQRMEAPAKAQVDRLSRLPVELLDYIFEITAWYWLTPRGISKSLAPSQERAISQEITVRSSQHLSRLLPTFDARPDRGHYVKSLVLRSLRNKDEPIHGEQLLHYLPNLVEIDFRQTDDNLSFRLLSQPALLPSLRIVRLRRTPLISLIIECLSRIPTLRFVEIFYIPDDEEEEEEDEQTWTPARQVLQVAIRAPYGLYRFNRIRQYFPSAAITSVNVACSTSDPLRPFFDILDCVTALSDMTDWRLPWDLYPSDYVLEAVEMEKKARGYGLTVESNLSELVQVFRLQVVECYNRAVGELYFNGEKDPLDYALALAAKHDLDIDRIEIDWRKESFSRKDLEWFQVKVDGIAGFESEDWAHVYGIKRRASSDSDEEEEEEDDLENFGAEDRRKDSMEDSQNLGAQL